MSRGGNYQRVREGGRDGGKCDVAAVQYSTVNADGDDGRDEFVNISIVCDDGTRLHFFPLFF